MNNTFSQDTFDNILTEFRKSLNKQILSHMKKKDISFYQLAHDTGLGQSNIKKLLTEEQPIKTPTLVRIVLALNLKITIDATGSRAGIINILLVNHKKK